MLGLDAVLPVAYEGSAYGLWVMGAAFMALVTCWVNRWDK